MVGSAKGISISKCLENNSLSSLEERHERQALLCVWKEEQGSFCDWIGYQEGETQCDMDKEVISLNSGIGPLVPV